MALPCMPDFQHTLGFRYCRHQMGLHPRYLDGDGAMSVFLADPDMVDARPDTFQFREEKWQVGIRFQLNE